jgi:hypothetical protein
MAVAVPLIAQVVLFKLKPAGSAGLLEQLVIVPPVLVGVAVAIGTPFV